MGRLVILAVSDRRTLASLVLSVMDCEWPAQQLVTGIGKPWDSVGQASANGSTANPTYSNPDAGFHATDAKDRSGYMMTSSGAVPSGPWTAVLIEG